MRSAKQHRRIFLLLSAAILTLAARAGATTFTWDGNGSNANWGTGANWVGNSSPATAVNSAVVMTGTTKRTNIDDMVVAINSLTFSNGGFTINGGTSSTSLGFLGNTPLIHSVTGTNTLNVIVTLAAPVTFTADAGTLSFDQQVTINSGPLILTGAGNMNFFGTVSFAGVGGLTDNSTGAISIDGSSGSYSGATAIKSGTLIVHNLADAGNTSDLGVASSAIQLGAATFSYQGFQNNSTNRTINLTGSATLDASGASTLALTGGITATGNQNLTLTGAGDGEISATTALSLGTGSLNVQSGTWTLAGAGSFSGAVTISGGELSISSLASLGTASTAVTLGSAKLQYTGTAATLSRGISLTSAATIDSSGSGGLTINGITGAANLTLTGSQGGTISALAIGSATLTANGGAWALNGANTYTGATTINAGTVQFNNGSAPNTAFIVNQNGTLDLNQTPQAITSLSGSGTVINVGGSSPASPGANNLTVGSGNTSTTFSGPISGPGGLTKIGAGALTLTGTNTYQDLTFINQGKLIVNGSLTNNPAAPQGFGANASNSFTGPNYINIAAGATLTGSGSVPMITGAGNIIPGDAPGILTAPQADPSSGFSIAFEFAGTRPNFANAPNSTNAILRLTAPSPFVSALTSANAINVYLDQTILTTGETFVGGFYADSDPHLLTDVQNGAYHFYILNPTSPFSFNGENFAPVQNFTILTISDPANFGLGAVNGSITAFTYTGRNVTMPEPGYVALLTVLSAPLFLGRRRRP
jgi:autotransporter-associated beta strand protein